MPGALAVLAVLLPFLLLGTAAPASAHAALRGSDPADGSVVASPPRYVTLTFSESVGLLDDSFRVLDPGNKRLDTPGPEHAPGRSDTARVRLPGGLGTGTFTVAWRVVSADSHPVSGALTFSVGKPSPTPPPVPVSPVEHPLTGGLYDTARYAAYLAAALLIGTAAFAALCRPPDRGPLRTLLRSGWWILAAATAVLLLLRAPYETGTAPVTAFDASALHRTLTGRPGQALLARLALLLCAAVLAARTRRAGGTAPPAVLAAGGALSVGLALTWAVSDHASAGVQVPVAIASSVLHLLATAVWLGGLAALLTTLYRTRPDRALVLSVVRFSRLASGAVAVLVITGVYQSWRGLGSWQALTDTPYGRLLLLKVAAVTLLLTIADRSRRWTARWRPAVAVGAAGDTEAAAEEPEMAGTKVMAVAAGRNKAEGRDEAGAATPPGATPLPAGPSAAPGTQSPPPPPGTGDDPTPAAFHRALRRTVLAEAAVAAVVLLLTTLLTGTVPGRAAKEAEEAGAAVGLPVAAVTVIPFDVGTPGGRGTVQITFDPGRVGRNSVEAVVFGPDGGLAGVPELRLSLTLPSQRIGPIDAKVTDLGGYWGTGSLTVPVAGTWTVKATVRVSDLDQVTVSKPVRIAR
ncbi:copper resistance protein CopC [Streptomyces sp. NPDC047000]|uniref:copper resistance CopC/CopD family protein n=1 Tax=Streptomyces sp. NPDC047000 TaxID=3155474 RepID=UPI0033C5754D